MTAKEMKALYSKLNGAKAIECNGKHYEIGEVNNMPEGKIDLIHAQSNLLFWTFKGLDVNIIY